MLEHNTLWLVALSMFVSILSNIGLMSSTTSPLLFGLGNPLLDIAVDVEGDTLLNKYVNVDYDWLLYTFHYKSYLIHPFLLDWYYFFLSFMIIVIIRQSSYTYTN